MYSRRVSSYISRRDIIAATASSRRFYLSTEAKKTACHAIFRRRPRNTMLPARHHRPPSLAIAAGDIDLHRGISNDADSADARRADANYCPTPTSAAAVTSTDHDIMASFRRQTPLAIGLYLLFSARLLSHELHVEMPCYYRLIRMAMTLSSPA